MNEKMWTGNQNSIFKTLGASNHVKDERQTMDYYATEPKATELLLQAYPNFENVLEPACGEGHISEVLKLNGIKTTSYDIVDRGYGDGAKNFFDITEWNGDMVTNPPYKYALEFVKHALKIIPTGNKVAMFLKVQFLEGKKRGVFFRKTPPAFIYVSSSRLTCAKNGDFVKYKHSSAVAYAWFIWDKTYKGKPTIDWIK